MYNDDVYGLSNAEMDNKGSMMFERPNERVPINKLLFKKYYNSKWANLKLILQQQRSVETSVKLQKQKTIEQFSSKCKEIYKKKIEIQLITKKNRQMFKSYNSNRDNIKDKDLIKIDNKISKFNITDISSEYEYNSLKEFLFCFRKNNELMLRLIECIDNKQCEILVPFLCHFFYENFFMESTEQEEILYIIYLLLEKEIDSLYTPSVSTFLDQSFVSKFLTEMGNRYEIKHYIEIILNYLIVNIEELNVNYNSLDIMRNKVGEAKDFYDMSYEEGVLHQSMKGKENNQIPNIRNDTAINIKISNEKISNINDKNIKKTVYISSSSMIKNEGVLNKNSTIAMRDTINNSTNKNYNNNISLKKHINHDLFNYINEKFIRDKVEKETDEIMKHFYVRQLRKLQASKDPNLFNGEKYYQKIKKEKKIYKFAVDQFNKSYTMIIDFIDELLTNLENDSIVPYSIKVICKFIYILLTKRFKNITKIQCNILICQFLFDKLIFPVLQNPDINDTGKDMIITFNTRKILSNIYVVCKKLVRGELFSIADKDYLVIFNKFIINNYHRINKIIGKLIHVKEPEKLTKLSEEFYNKDCFKLEDVKRNESLINYDYFKENPNDFMQHRSICFSKNEFFVFYNSVKNNQERFIEEDSYLQTIFKDLSNKIPDKIKNNKYEYYLIISDEYEDEINELLFHSEKKRALGNVNNIEDIIKNIKYCIGHLISNIEISPNWKWVNDNSNAIFVFQFIHKYLSKYHSGNINYMKKNDQIPLTWYSSYIIKNIRKIKNDWCYNDYDKLYNSLVTEITSQFKKLRRLNDFLTVNMYTKFLLIDHKIKKFVQELNNVKKTELNIKTLQFIEKAKIKVCLTTIDDLMKYTTPNSLDLFNMDSPHKLVLSIRDKKSPCIHKKKIEPKLYHKEKHLFKKIHCNNINQFCLHLADYYKYIYEDISGISTENHKKLSKNQTTKDLKKRQSVVYNIIRGISSKEIIENYLKYLSDEIQKSEIFNTELQNINEEKIKNIEADKQNALHIIRNYILKTLCIKICENEKEINNEYKNKDKSFRKMCKRINWISPEQLDIKKEVFDNNLFKKAQYHIKRTDSLRTPGGILEQFGLGVQLINSMFIFMLNEKSAEAGDLLPLIIYGVIMSSPKRMIFNIQFIKYFMSQNELLGNNGYNIIQAESTIRFIQSIKGKEVKMDEQEFEDRCKLNNHLINENKKINNIQSINDNEDSDDD